MKKRFLFILAITMAAVCSLQAVQVSESAARQVADQFFTARAARLAARPGQSSLRLAYTAEQERFYVFDRSSGSGFVVVAGDDRLPQVLGYSDTGVFNTGNIPPSMRAWMEEMSREIAYLQSHSGVVAHHPVKPANVVEPLLTTIWNQGWPYNLLCPTYGGEEAILAVTGCIATATAQIMNYHQWPLQGTGSHSYYCNVNDTDPVELSADFSQSFYDWDNMLDYYDQSSSAESCLAVAKLMSDVGISVDMGYGASSGAQETAVVKALTRYFGYSNRHYLLERDLFGADEWDQLLIDELNASRPMLYCGYTYTQGSMSGHAYVLDGVDDRGYFHVNWGWGGDNDGYFMVSLLAPGSGMNFKYGQDCLFGVVPAPDADKVAGVLYVRGLLHPEMKSVTRGGKVTLKFSDIYAHGNLVDTAGVEYSGYWPASYDLIPMELRVIDRDGVVRQSSRFNYKVYIEGWGTTPPKIDFVPDITLGEGDYTVKIAYSENKDGNYGSWVRDDYGNDVYCNMHVTNDMVYVSDCFLSDRYDLQSMEPDQNIFVGEPFEADVTLSNMRRYGPSGGQPEADIVGNIRLALQKNGKVVATGEPITISSIPRDSTATYRLQMTAPEQWGRYELMVVDDCGRTFTPQMGWYDLEEQSGAINIIVVPKSDALIEDFESMHANSSTSEKNVQGAFTKWSFNKSGVRAPGEGKCHGTNAVMMKKPSTFYSVEPINHRIFMAEATFFNNSSTDAKFTLEYSVDGAATWKKAMTIEDELAADVPATSVVQAIWQLNLRATENALFRIAMTGGGSAAAYVDDFILRYNDESIAGDVNVDGEVNIGDVNAVIDLIFSESASAVGDVNGDGEINIADVNAIIDIIMGE